MEFITNSPEETQTFGRLFSQMLEPGDVVALIGDLGSGKTCLTSGICKGLEVENEVTSPTFVLINEYEGRLPVYHFDFYRLVSEKEIWNLGIDDYVNGDGICIIEWAERGLSLLPDSRIEVHLTTIFQNGSESTRQFKINKIDKPFSADLLKFSGRKG